MVYTIIAPNPITGKAWGLDFTEGVAHTDNKALADKLVRKGYRVEGDGVAAGRISCPHCDKTYASEETLKAHTREKHPETVQE